MPNPFGMMGGGMGFGGGRQNPTGNQSFFRPKPQMGPQGNQAIGPSQGMLGGMFGRGQGGMNRGQTGPPPTMNQGMPPMFGGGGGYRLGGSGGPMRGFGRPSPPMMGPPPMQEQPMQMSDQPPQGLAPSAPPDRLHGQAGKEQRYQAILAARKAGQTGI